MNPVLVFSSLCLVVGGLLIAVHLFGPRRAPLSERLATAGGTKPSPARFRPGGLLLSLPRHFVAGYERDLRRAGGTKTRRRHLEEKVTLALGAPFIVLVPYSAAVARPPSLVVAGLLAVCGFFVPDLLLVQEAKRRREALFVDLPDMLSVLSLALGAGQSLRRALELAARDCDGPLATELERALSLARRQQGLSERDALVQVARETGEPTFTRFAELLAAKESPYLAFLRQQAREARAEQARYLERAGERAYLAMHAPVAPLLAVLVLLLAYGFLHFLAHTT